LLESVERAANRTAAQIDMTLRQTRADQAAYLRNNDKAMTLLSSDRKTNSVVFVLDNIRSAFNVGSIFRTAETAGMAEIITCGITAHPPHPKLRKTAFSAIDVVPHRHFDDIIQCIESLRGEGFKIVAMETTSKSQLYTAIDYPSQKIALVLGNEVTGVDTRVMDQSDFIVEIPTYGLKNSLNVASAAPVVAFEVLRQWEAKGLAMRAGSP
jgi:23S rRNA (guanosine2251-2'-O)-methyltransferase